MPSPVYGQQKYAKVIHNPLATTMEDARTKSQPNLFEDGRNASDDMLPEEKLNSMAIRMAFLLRVMGGCGALAFAWATVVLLGGFSTLIKQKDFWFVTIIVFMETTWLFNNSKPEDQFYARIPEAMLKADKIANLGNGSWRRHKKPSIVDAIKTFTEIKSNAFSGKSIFAVLYQVTLSNLQIAAVIACIVMSSKRLKVQDYVDPIYQHNDDHKNIRWSLNIFYGLVLSQCIIYFLTGIVANPLRRLITVCNEYKLGIWGVLALSRYLQECLVKCVSGDLRGVVNMDLVMFAKDLSNSNSLGDQLVGLRILDFLLRKKKYKGKVLKKLRASIDTVEKAIYIAGLKTDVDEDTRGHAGRILLELAEDLHVECFPGILQSISSLLSTNKKNSRGSSVNCAQMKLDVDILDELCVKKEFILLGLDILVKLVTDPDNCAQMKDAEHLLTQIIGLTTYRNDSLVGDIDKDIVEDALNVLHKLVGMAGKVGQELRSQVSKSINIIANIQMILINYPEIHPEMLVQAIGILACLAFDGTTKKEISKRCLIIRKLISLLVGEMDVVQDSSIKMMAAEALVSFSFPVQEKDALSMTNEIIIKSILDEIKPEEMQQIVMVLSDESVNKRIMVAKLLQNLRPYQGPEHTTRLKRIDKALPIVLHEIKFAVEQIDTGSSDEHSAPEHMKEFEELRTGYGKLLESFVGLCVQICTRSEVKEFTDALASAYITDDTFVQILKKILDVYGSPTADYPGIRRVLIQQMNWMIQKDEKYLSVFLKHELDKTLENVMETTSKLEDFWLFRSSIEAFEHRESISSLLKTSPILQPCRSD